MNRLSSLALLLMLSGCAAEQEIPDAGLTDAPHLDAQADAAQHDAAAERDAFTALDAHVELDAFTELDASTAPDAHVEVDASTAPDAHVEVDAFTPPDAHVEVDAFTAPDAFTTPDAPSCVGVTMCRDGDGCCPSTCDTPRDSDCICEARTCGAQRCGTIDDGCGRTVTCGAPCSTWTRVTSPPVIPRDRVLLAHLGTDRALLLVTGTHRAYTYEALSNTWTTITPPPPNDWDSLAYAGDGRVVLVSSIATYEYDGTTWSTHAAPPVRMRNGSAYAGPGRVIHFGGHASTGITARTYMYSTTSHTWTELSVTGTLPPIRTRAQLEWIGGGRLLLTGGLSSSVVRDDAWIFDTAARTWTATADPRGGGRIYDALAHLRTGVVVHYGGKGTLTAAAASDGFRRWEAGVWTAFTRQVVWPEYIFDHAMTYLSPGRVLMVEGTSTGTAGLSDERGFAWVYDIGTGDSDYGL